MIPELIIKSAAGIIGSAIGKVVGKVIEYIPSPGESNRNNLDKLKKERDELITKKETAATHARLVYIMHLISVREKAAVNSQS